MSLKNSVTPPRIDPGTVPLVAQRLNHYATPCPYIFIRLHTNKQEGVGIDKKRNIYFSGDSQAMPAHPCFSNGYI